MIKYTASTLKKLEEIFTESGYKIIYEKGNFRSGYCLVKDKNMIVINKFYQREARINCLLDLLREGVDIAEEGLEDKLRVFYLNVLKVLQEA